MKLIDFGFAVYKYSLKTMSNKEKYVGSTNYTAPEVL
jgi:serine/threonine protein kinase